MKLADFLSPARIVVPLECDTLDAARGALLSRLEASGSIADLDRLMERAAEERGEDMVAFADQAFLLHYRTDTASALQVALGVCVEGIKRSLDDGGEQRAPVLAVVIGPPRLAARQLQVVRALGRLLQRPEAIEALRHSPSPEALAMLPIFSEVDLPEQLLVRDLMTERPRTTTADAPLRTAARELIRTGLGALPVVDGDERLLGMLSERELMRNLLATDVLSDGSSRYAAPAVLGASKTVRDVMTRQVLCVAPEQPVAEVAALMSNKDVERVPVVREGRLVGFLTRGDIVRKLIGP
jgi:CBS domain-containing protein/mannitol/fructose-specific phosphotransferase system IIA component (Ntr-type)